MTKTRTTSAAEEDDDDLTCSVVDDDRLIVNYHDACIYGRDLKLLNDPRAWLNDACLHFHLTRLQYRQYKDEDCAEHVQLHHHEQQQDLFWDPSVASFLVHQCEDQDELLDLARAYHNFQGTKRIFIPVNDTLTHSSNWQVPGMGSHWSLLVLLLHSHDNSVEHEQHCVEFLHFDSVPGSSNQVAAETLARKWIQLLSVLPVVSRDSGQASQSQSSAPPTPVVQKCQTPAQLNGYDCGVHVLAAVEAIVLTKDDENKSNKNGNRQRRSSKEDYEKAVQRHVGDSIQNNPNFCVELRRRIARDIWIAAGSQKAK